MISISIIICWHYTIPYPCPSCTCLSHPDPHSTGLPHGGIHDVIAEQKLRGIILPDGSVRLKDTDENSSRSGSGKQKDKTVHTRRKPKSQRKLDERAQKQQRAMPDHFFCVRVDGWHLRKAAFEAQAELVRMAGDDRLRQGCQGLRSLHITLVRSFVRCRVTSIATVVGWDRNSLGVVMGD